jgi:molybdopterin converting factor subunit 1
VKVAVRLFAVAKQTAGRETVELELADGATIAQLRSRLAAEVPPLAGLLGQMMFAIEARYAADEAVIPPGAEVACIPPVSGG